MVVKVLKMQISSMLRKKETVLTFFIVMAFMFVNFYYNMYLNYKVGNISQMQDFVKMLTLSDWTISGYFFTDFLPLLVVIPTACSYIADRDTRIKLYSVWNNIPVIIADRFYPSSKLCSCCGNIKKDLKLSDRIYKCECGNVIDRDFQASLNLKDYGEKFAS